MKLKIILLFIFLVFAGKSIAANKSRGSIQEQTIGPSCDIENHCNTVVTAVLGQASLVETNRSISADKTVTVTLQAMADQKTQGILRGADFVTLALDTQKASPLMDVFSVPVFMTLQSYGPENEEMLTHTFKGGCIAQDMTLSRMNCRFTLSTNPFQRLYLEVK